MDEKKQLYIDYLANQKNQLSKDEKMFFEYSEKRHKKNEETINRIKFIVKMPYNLFYKAPKKLINVITHKDKKMALEQENERLKLVLESKERARIKMKLGNTLLWDNKYLVSDGIFNIGKDVNTGNLIKIDFNINSNLLVGGMPGTGKTKLIQLIIFQCLKYGCNCFIADFKGGVDTIRFKNKSNVITKHEELLAVLKKFKKEIQRRQQLFISVGAENLKEYNEITNENVKREYLFIDELGEATEISEVEGMTDKEVKKLKNDIENNLKSIARLGRAFGLNLICGTQRPDTGILEGQTRDQFGGRVCFKAIANTSTIVLSSKIASELPDIKGRSIVMSGTNFIETQVFFWNKETLKEIQNKKINLEKNKEDNNDNNENKKKDEIIDIDID